MGSGMEGVMSLIPRMRATLKEVPHARRMRHRPPQSVIADYVEGMSACRAA